MPVLCHDMSHPEFAVLQSTATMREFPARYVPWHTTQRPCLSFRVQPPRENYVPVLCHGVGGSRGLVVKVLDSKFESCEFKTHTGHGSFSKLRQFRLPYSASVYSAANEYKHCLEGTCDGLVSRPGESV